MPSDVLHLTSQYPPVGQGGLGNHVSGLTHALARHLRVSVISPVHLPGNPLDPAAALQWGLAAASGGLIHAHNYEVALPALIAKALTGAPLVVTLHLPAPEPYRSLERRLLEAADAVVAVSRAVAGECLERNWQMSPPVVIQNGVDASFYTPDKAVQRETGRLLFAGRLSPQKGCDIALHALRELLPAFPGLRLHVAGAGSWEQSYRNLARRFGLGDQVRWLGWLDPDALREEYRRCSAFLMPSRFEPFGLSALEAMACGAPVVASRVGGLPEFITDGASGLLVPPGDSDGLAQAMRRLLVSPAHAQRLAIAAALSASELTWDRAAEQTLRLYRGLPPWTPRRSLATDRQLLVAQEVLRTALAPEPAGS